MTIRSINIGLVLLLVVLGLSAPGKTVAPAAYRVIVHPGNPTESMTRSELSKAFLKTMRRWSHGDKIRPVDQPPDSSIRASFSEDTFGRNVGAIKSYWQREFFAGRETPPPELQTDQEIVAFVAGNRGAIGYVSWSARLPPTVKAIEITP